MNIFSDAHFLSGMKAWFEVMNFVILSQSKATVKMAYLKIPLGDKMILNDTELGEFTDLIQSSRPQILQQGSMLLRIIPQKNPRKVAIACSFDSFRGELKYYIFDIEAILQEFAPDKVNVFLLSLK